MPLDPVGRLCHDRPMAEPATRYAQTKKRLNPCLVYTTDASDQLLRVVPDGGRRINDRHLTRIACCR